MILVLRVADPISDSKEVKASAVESTAAICNRIGNMTWSSYCGVSDAPVAVLDWSGCVRHILKADKIVDGSVVVQHQPSLLCNRLDYSQFDC